jgi:hypothetical protein
MLETVREYAKYALERLAEHPDAGAVHDRYAAWCLDFTRQATPHLVRADRIPWLTRLNAELPNILAGLSWALDNQRTELALQLASDLGAYWWRTSDWEAALPWIDAALEHPHGTSTKTRAQALLARARLVSMREQQRYGADLQGSLELFRACDDDAGIAVCLAHLADIEAWDGQSEDSAALDEAVRLARRANDEDTTALVLMQRAFAATDYGETASRARTALEQLRRVGNLYGVADTCVSTGYMAIFERRYHEALVWLAEGLNAARQLEHPNLMFHIRGNQGLAMLFLDELDDAAQAFRDALAFCRESGLEKFVYEPLLGLAAVAARRGQLVRAAHLTGAATALEAVSKGHLEVAIESRLTAMLTAPREAYGAENWDHVSAEAASLTVYEAIDLALERRRFPPAARRSTAPSPT